MGRGGGVVRVRACIHVWGGGGGCDVWIQKMRLGGVTPRWVWSLTFDFWTGYIDITFSPATSLFAVAQAKDYAVVL